MRPPTARGRRVWRIALAGFVFLPLWATGLHAQLEVDELELFLTAGTSPGSGTFNVRNTSGSAQTVEIKLLDWDREANGRNRFADPGTLAGSCHPTIEVFPTTVQLEAGETQAVRVTYRGGVRPQSCWTSVSVGVAPAPRDTTRSVQLLVNLQHMVKIYVDPQTPVRTIEIADLDVGSVAAEPGAAAQDSTARDVLAGVRGSGNAQARVKGRVEYRTVGDSVVASVNIPEFPVLPGAVRQIRSRMPSLKAGNYIVLVMFDYGGSELIAGQIELEIQR